jgi:phosphatidylinositol alpha-1,6-mannosyltransferase
MYAKHLLKSAALALSHRFGAVHAGRVLPEGLVALIVARSMRRPLLVFSHGEEITTWRQSAKFRAMRFVYRSADIVIANSEFTRDELLKLGVKASQINIVYPGVDISKFRPGLSYQDLRASVGLQAGQGLILSVGRLSRRKGFDRVICALPHLLERSIDVQYVVAGIGEDCDYLANLARQQGVADRVHLLGHVPTEDLPRWYNAADVVVMPNREIDGDTEGFGMVFIEAAACAKATIAGLAGGTGAAVLDGVTGLRVDGSSIEAVASGLIRILSDPDYARMLGEQGHQRAVNEFAWDRVAERVGTLRI